MNIATILFTYNRSMHTQATLNGLKKNKILPEKLYIFQDGMKKTTDTAEWNRVSEVITAVDWCDTEVIISKKNKGLANSIVTGINYVLQRHDAVIVLEDDCVPHPDFMAYMISSLIKYESVEKVYSISGYAWPIHLDKDMYDAYFCQRICSCGWGTWKERWNCYERNYMLLNQINADSHAAERLAKWGVDLTDHLVGNITGECDSWAVFWALKVIEKDGYCLNPYKQLIYNIGFDGSGRHSGKSQDNYLIEKESTVQENSITDCFRLPDKIECTKECETELKFLFAGKTSKDRLKFYRDILLRWIKRKQTNRKLSIPAEWGDCIAVWGKGEVLDCLLTEISGQTSVEYIIESRPSQVGYKGIPIISIDKLPKSINNIIVIPYFDLEIIAGKVKKIRPDICLWGIDELI